MNIFTHNFNPSSDSGPNKFTRQLFKSLIKQGLVTHVNHPSQADLEFCLIQQQYQKTKPMALRLDGIYFNSEQDYNNQNAPIKYAYDNADVVVFQSNFNKSLIETWFGPHKNSRVIHNAADLELLGRVSSYYYDKSVIPKKAEVWTCASSWRPH